MPDPLLSPTDFRFTADGELVVHWPTTPPDGRPDRAEGVAGPAPQESATTTGDDG
ncbi:hypothetical protein OG271_17095 [Micromonospora rifamycinica]|uniref:hypothetical protein n=1 Tax=Micromonospora rifamycinica TaxID=291594 RepID=UPI002E2D5E6C|nr:hypothetical protein [Micromonospora rifamycinica]